MPTCDEGASQRQDQEGCLEEGTLLCIFTMFLRLGE